MSTITKTNIKEANNHLQELHQRIFELESQVQLHVLHVEDLQHRNNELERELIEVKKRSEESINMKDEQIKQLYSTVGEKEEQLEELLVAAEERDEALIKMEAKSRVFHEIIEHRTALEHILQVLQEVNND